MKCGIVVFPGSNCDLDSFHILHDIFCLKTKWIWHKDNDLGDCDLVVLPGGFSYGDYLRPGAISRFSPVMKAVVEHARSGKLLLGICNGFQILVESGLLPGSLIRNRNQTFVCKPVRLRVENNDTPFTKLCEPQEELTIPIAHADGNFFIEPDSLQRLEENSQVVFRYCSIEGVIEEEANPNGSVGNIAGIVNENRNVLGMMPHPERCADPLWPNVDGQTIFKSLIQSFS
tara:strand:- start:801 stop:1490 length:690 start_codon:yes stop_codon:yes gene_type:complete